MNLFMFLPTFLFLKTFFRTNTSEYKKFLLHRFIFLINLFYMKCVQKVPKLKLYLPRQKLTTNETLISFKVPGVFKRYRD